MGPRSWPLWCEIVCSECARSGCGHWTYASPRRLDILRQAEAEGWELASEVHHNSVGKDWLCKWCAKRQREIDRVKAEMNDFREPIPADFGMAEEAAKIEKGD